MERPHDTRMSLSLEEFEAVATEVVNSLPEHLREAMQNFDVMILEEPDEHLDPDGVGLLGLYQGVPLPERGINYTGVLPDIIYIFRQPHLALGLPTNELRQEIAKTVIHEIAHYFGIDDDHLNDIGWG